VSVYVLVHGGFYGGWGWAQVARSLRAAGHEVYTPTLTGLGERAHLATPETGLDTHIRDIVGVLECEDLRQVILVGHSYGSMVITGVAERVPDRLSRLVYVDTVIPKNGESWSDLLGPEVVQSLLDLTNNKGDGWRTPLITNPPRWQPHPLKTTTDHLEVKNPLAVPIPRAYIHCTARQNEGPLGPFWPRIDRAAEEAKQEGWWYRSLPTGHGAMLTMPKEITVLLLELG
jgi:pimeloyl-ACP methyl ester carboxylesterase